MIETARKWVPLIQKKEQPDLLIGLFHAGWNYNYAGENENTPFNENATMLVAKQVDGFDLIISGHDHQEKAEEIINNAGNRVLIVDPRSHGRVLGKSPFTSTGKANNMPKHTKQNCSTRPGWLRTRCTYNNTRPPWKK